MALDNLLRCREMVVRCHYCCCHRLYWKPDSALVQLTRCPSSSSWFWRQTQTPRGVPIFESDWVTAPHWCRQASHRKGYTTDHHPALECRVNNQVPTQAEACENTCWNTHGRSSLASGENSANHGVGSSTCLGHLLARESTLLCSSHLRSRVCLIFFLAPNVCLLPCPGVLHCIVYLRALSSHQLERMHTR